MSHRHARAGHATAAWAGLAAWAVCLSCICAGPFGCARADIQVTREPSPAYTPPAQDTRSAADLRPDNQHMRAALEKVQGDMVRWDQGVAQRERQKDDLKRQRDDLKKDRDKYKKLAND